jgi:gluconate 2-dehydrogenase gamma chain
MLQFMAAGAFAARFPGFRKWQFVCQQEAERGAQIRPAAYTPRFFTTAEYAALERLTELIIPSDDTPGAKEAGVAEFIDFMVSSDPSIQDDFRHGLAWLDGDARRLHQKPFVELNAAAQTALLRSLAYSDQKLPGDESGRRFFHLVRRYTVMGYYTTRIGLEQLDCPSLKSYSESPGCPHVDDPEHRRLSPA